ncbi:MAG: guanylate kinase [Ruminococcaceae bacterium]|nr:guanylate kinase [Oscillospiraceae bacterium]
MKRGKIIVLSGPSGVGKGTVLREVMRNRSDLQFSVSATTRPIRPNEVNGENYWFMDKAQFEQLISDDALLEYVTYADNYYGTPIKPVEEAMDNGIHVVLEIEVQGAMKLFERRDDVISIFIAPPSFEELKRRLLGRGDTAQQIAEKRLRIARWECEAAKKYKYVVVNDDVQRAASEIDAILTAESCRSEYYEMILPEEEM